ncbi:unnamed protein product [Effrenium voratum]|nr:unnamed protein product [Effrenium voratum]
MSVLLSRQEDFTGGMFSTFAGHERIEHEMQRGDGVLFLSEKRHNVSAVTGERRTLVLELWEGTHEEEVKQRQEKEMEEKMMQAQGLKPEPVPRPMTEDTLRRDGCDEMNRVLRTIATEPVKLRRPGFRCNCFRGDPSLEAPKSPKPSSPVRMSQTETRLQWRSRVDNSLRRLMLNVDLDGDERLRDFAHQARCNHLDKIFDWYQTHGGKEVRKEIQRANAPAFVRYSQDGPVMPGSLRVPKTLQPKQSAPLFRPPAAQSCRPKEKMEKKASTDTLNKEIDTDSETQVDKKDTSLPGLARGISSPALIAWGPDSFYLPL